MTNYYNLDRTHTNCNSTISLWTQCDCHVQCSRLYGYQRLRTKAHFTRCEILQPQHNELHDNKLCNGSRIIPRIDPQIRTKKIDRALFREFSRDLGNYCRYRIICILYFSKFTLKFIIVCHNFVTRIPRQRNMSLNITSIDVLKLYGASLSEFCSNLRNLEKRFVITSLSLK